MIRYFRCENGFIGVTPHCPQGMQGLVYVGRGPLPGKGIESVCKQGYARNQLQKLPRIHAEEVPEAWFEAIGLEKRSMSEPRTVELVIQLPWEGRKKKSGHRRYRQEQLRFWLALAIGVTVAWYIVFVWQYR